MSKPSSLFKRVIVSKATRWTISLLLCIPCFLVFEKSIRTSSSTSTTSTTSDTIFSTPENLGRSGFSKDGSFYFEATTQAADYFLSVYNILSSVWSVVAAFIMLRFCRQIYKDKMIRLIGERARVQIDMLANLHNSLYNSAPGIALFADNISLSSILAIIVIALSTAVNIYSSAIPLAIDRTYDLFDTSPKQKKVSIVSLTSTAFANGSPFDAKGQKSGNFFPFYYYSQLPNRGLFYGRSLDNGSIPLIRLPFGGLGSESDNNKAEQLPVMINSLPVAVINISDYSFKIVPQTATGPYSDIYDKWSVTAIEDGSNFTYASSVDYSCLTSKPSPWDGCKVPEKLQFTIVQKTPLLGGSYDYGSSTFHIPGAIIDGYFPKGTPLNGSLETAYVFEGTLGIRRSRLFGKLNATSGSWSLVQRYKGESLYEEYSEVEEKLFKKIVIAVARLLEKQFTSQSAKERAKYTWNQMRELIALDHLDKELSGYDKHDYARELERRITAVANQWIYLNTLHSEEDSTLADSDSLIVNFVTGRISSRITFSLAAILGVVLMIVWIALALLATLILVCMSQRRKLRISNSANGTQVHAIEEICSTPQGLALLLKKLSSNPEELDNELLLVSVEKNQPSNRRIVEKNSDLTD